MDFAPQEIVVVLQIIILAIVALLIMQVAIVPQEMTMEIAHTSMMVVAIVKQITQVVVIA